MAYYKGKLNKKKILYKAAAVENIKSKLNIHIRREREGNNER